jgi:molybdopterin synthase catalytic subunit
MLKRAEVSGEEEDEDEDEEEEAVAEASATTIFVGEVADSTAGETATLLDLETFLGAAVSETVAVTAATAGVVDSAKVAAEEVLDVLTILSDYTHISSVFLSSFQYILYITILYFIIT